jgi:hypothetical protein
MRSQNTRSGGEGLERSCTGTAAGWLAGPEPVEGVELLHAWLTTEVYQRHRHDTYAIGVTDRGVQVFDYRGSSRVSTRGQVVVLYPDEAHDGRAGTREGFGYRIVYVEPARLAEALRALRGGPGPLPFVSEAVSANPALARAVEDAFRYELARQFRAMLGTSPHRYLLMRRLALARDLIHAARPLVDVASEAGFADQAHFTRVFRSAFGLTPARYRALRIGPRDLTGPRAVQ